METLGDTKKMMSDAKFYEAYSRFDPKLNRYESWDESVTRVMDMHRTYYKEKIKGSDELHFYLKKAEDLYKTKTVLGAQRALQFGGEQLLKHQMKMFNCVSSYADRPDFFGEIFYVLLCGSGAGFSVQRHHVAKLPAVVLPNKQAKTFVVEDSIEGWASAVDVLLSSYFEDGGKHPEFKGRKVHFDLKKIRPKGSYISGGFKAPGPEPLRKALDLIDLILYNAATEERKLKPIEVYDIVMHIADSVISGGVRRSATICLFSLDDEEMINAKTGNWFTSNPQRARSNNSAVILRHLVTKEKFHNIMKKVREFGEPGFFFVDTTENTTNPCCEIGMYPQIDGKSGFQGCNLTEINGSHCNSEEDFYRACEAASILGTLQAGYTNFRFLSETTKKIFDREALIGVSVTGWVNNPTILFNKKVLEKGAQIVKETNKKVAKLIGINPAARSTAVKPSGNASVLLMTASGIHAEHSQYYLRNAQMNKESEVAKLIQQKNPYMVEDSIYSANDSDFVISFPVVAKEGSIFRNDMLGINQLEKIKLVQKHWVEAGTDVDLCVDKTVRHNVSNTVTVDDWDKVEQYIFNNKEYFAGISFAPMSGDKAYYQAPFTQVLSEQEILDKYGEASLFASGLIVDGMTAFNNLWSACNTAKGIGEDLSLETHDNVLKRDWCRRFNKFSASFFDNNDELTEHCLKDVSLLHRWSKIQQNLKDINWLTDLGEKQYVDIDTLSAQSCHGGACEIDF